MRPRKEEEEDGEGEEEKTERTHISGTYALPSFLASFHSVHSSCVATTKTYFAPLISYALVSRSSLVSSPQAMKVRTTLTVHTRTFVSLAAQYIWYLNPLM